ncbi:hypothetical protein TorRG33x02_139920 [Trema orientale]|uniref:Uncharacterized protein n=1 Tax=Trema orientale TaxID=63057 RepID=A0A2P5EX73_TREOI|nr:hypothetical protein TorRG33x02_139920 [Trema orientale]
MVRTCTRHQVGTRKEKKAQSSTRPPPCTLRRPPPSAILGPGPTWSYGFTGKKEEGEPERRALHKEPGQRHRHCWASPRAVVLAVQSLEQVEGSGSRWPDEENGEEAVPKQVMI